VAGCEKASGALFLLVYTAINHFPWTNRYRPDRLPNWRDPGNSIEVNEYLRRKLVAKFPGSRVGNRTDGLPACWQNGQVDPWGEVLLVPRVRGSHPNPAVVWQTGGVSFSTAIMRK
jgi:hypothetical protein